MIILFFEDQHDLQAHLHHLQHIQELQHNQNLLRSQYQDYDQNSLATPLSEQGLHKHKFDRMFIGSESEEQMDPTSEPMRILSICKICQHFYNLSE